MDNLESGKDKIKKISELLKNETLEPAKREAQKIIETAQTQAHEMIREAEKKAEALLQQAREQNAKEKERFDASLSTAMRQGTEELRQQIEETLFSQAIEEWLGKELKDIKKSAKLIDVLIKAVESDGVSADFSAWVPKALPADEVNALLLKKTVASLREKGVVTGEFVGGVMIKLHDQKLTLDVSQEAIKELLANYIRKDFRELLFGNE